MKTNIYRSIVALAVILIMAFLAWIFALHGVGGVFHTTNIFRIGVYIFAAFGLILLALALWLFIPTGKRLSSIRRRLTTPITILAVIGIVIPTFGFVYLNVNFTTPLSSPTPELILSGNTGTYGISDMAVVRYTVTPSRDFFLWGTGDSTNSFFEDSPVEQHVYVIRDLKPGTEYRYRINNGIEYHFKTPEAETLHFAAAGDAHIGSGGQTEITSKMMAQIANPENDFDYFFSLGDLVNWGFSENQWQDTVRTLSPLISNIPTGFVPGNHDTALTGLNNYEYYCSPAGTDNQSGSRLWYRIDAGKIHFLVLDLESSAETYTAAQAVWLEEQLKYIPAGDWKIVLSHGYFYSSGYVEYGWKGYDNPETIGPLVPLFERYGVNLVLSGHNHQSELLQKAGVTYVISGAFSGLRDKERTYTSPYSIWYDINDYGFTDVTINGNEAEIVFRDRDFRTLNSFNVQK